MDILTDKPIRNSTHSYPLNALSSYIAWLKSGKERQPFLQGLLVHVLEAQLSLGQYEFTSQWSPRRITPWLRLLMRIISLAMEAVLNSIVNTYSKICVQILESHMFKQEIKLPRHSEDILISCIFADYICF